MGVVDLLVIGSEGQLGRALVAAAAARGVAVVGHDVDTLDITDPQAVRHRVAEVGPRWVVNCAAHTAVDRCEEEETLATAVNDTAVGHLAAACEGSGAALLHVSTDYVFPGDGRRPYREEDPVAPLGVYGRTKLGGERRARMVEHHLVVRTAWLYGVGGSNFVEAIRRQIEAGRETLQVVDDQWGCPTFCGDLAGAMLDLMAAGAEGTFHAVNHGATTWCGFAREIVRLLGAATEVEPVTTEAYSRPAPRPAYSVLDTARLATALGRHLPPWQNGLARYLRCAS